MVAPGVSPGLPYSARVRGLVGGFFLNSRFIEGNRTRLIAALLDRLTDYFARKKCAHVRPAFSLDIDAVDRPDTLRCVSAPAYDALGATRVRDAKRKCQSARLQFARLGRAMPRPANVRRSQ